MDSSITWSRMSDRQKLTPAPPLVTSVDERWDEGPLCVGLAVGETGVGRIHVAISLSIVHLGG